jgi:hypothetical protein
MGTIERPWTTTPEPGDAGEDVGEGVDPPSAAGSEPVVVVASGAEDDDSAPEDDWVVVVASAPEDVVVVASEDVVLVEMSERIELASSGLTVVVDELGDDSFLPERTSEPSNSCCESMKVISGPATIALLTRSTAPPFRG